MNNFIDLNYKEIFVNLETLNIISFNDHFILLCLFLKISKIQYRP